MALNIVRSPQFMAGFTICFLPAGPKINWTDQEPGNVHRLIVEQQKELIVLNSQKKLLSSLDTWCHP
jgi:hypothetical protein